MEDRRHGLRIEAARLLTWRAAVLKGRGDKRASQECSMAKLVASETANFCAYEAVQIFGGYGYSREYEVERLYRDARITTLYEGTSRDPADRDRQGPTSDER